MYDVVIIGAGAIGCSIANELSKFDISLAVLEKNIDVAMGATGANSGILHAGHDCETGTKMAEFNVEGNKLFDKLCLDLDVPIKRSGSLVLAFDEKDIKQLEILKTRGKNNGLKEIEIINSKRVFELEQNISRDVIAALWTPTAGIINPYELNVALMEISQANGAEFYFDACVANINIRHNENEKNQQYFEIITTNGQCYNSHIIINCAGVFADKIANMIGDYSFTISPRRGEYIIFDRPSPVNRPVFQVPTHLGKGVLVSPTVDGNFFIGPSAQNQTEKEDKSVSMEGMKAIKQSAEKSVAKLPYIRQINTFSGIRAIPSSGDFVIEVSEQNSDFINVAGICSPGLTSAPAIAKYIFKMFNYPLKSSFIMTRQRITNFKFANNAQKRELIKKDRRYSNIVCRCEIITEAEIIEAIKRGAVTVDGVKRRTRTTMGRCQGSFCTPKILEIMSRELNLTMEQITKFGGNSYYIDSNIRENEYES